MDHLAEYERKLEEAGKIAALDELTDEDIERMEALEAEAAEHLAAHKRAEAAKAARLRVQAGLSALDQPPAETVTTSATINLRPLLDAPARAAVEDDPALGYKSLAHFAMDVHRAGPGEVPQSEALRIAAASGMSQAIGHDGGFLVPPAFATNIWDGMRTSVNNLLQMTDQYTVTGESLTFPANAETSRVAGSRYGGVRGYWIGEADQITSSQPKFRQMKLEPQELAVLIYVTDKLLRNSPVALEQYLVRAATEEILFLSNDALVNGTGSGMPLGVLAAGCTVSVSAETGQAATTIVKENLDKMYARLHPRSWPNAVWCINQDCIPQLLNLQMAVGTGGQPVFLPPGGISGSPYSTIYGRPVLPIEYCATLGTVGDIILADWSAYATGVQGAVSSAVSIHLKFDYAESAFRFMWAVDGQPWLASAITPANGSNTLSPFITLATRS